MSAASIDATIGAGDFATRIDLSIPATGITVLAAPSGAGKSLTLETLAGLRPPLGGRIVLGDRVVDDPAAGIRVRAQDRRIGMVFQDSVLLPHRTALDNVALAVGGGRRAARRDAARRLLADVGAEGLAERRPSGLSGGQRQRVALARALARGPALLALDEPFTALDPPVRAQLGALVREVARRHGIPAILVTHDEAEARAVGDRIVRIGGAGAP